MPDENKIDIRDLRNDIRQLGNDVFSKIDKNNSELRMEFKQDIKDFAETLKTSIENLNISVKEVKTDVVNYSQQLNETRLQLNLLDTKHIKCSESRFEKEKQIVVDIESIKNKQEKYNDKCAQIEKDVEAKTNIIEKEIETKTNNIEKEIDKKTIKFLIWFSLGTISVISLLGTYIIKILSNILNLNIN